MDDGNAQERPETNPTWALEDLSHLGLGIDIALSSADVPKSLELKRYEFELPFNPLVPDEIWFYSQNDQERVSGICGVLSGENDENVINYYFGEAGNRKTLYGESAVRAYESIMFNSILDYGVPPEAGDYVLIASLGTVYTEGNEHSHIELRIVKCTDVEII